MKVKGWFVTGLLSVFNFLSGCGGTTMNQDAKQVSNFKWYAVATAYKAGKNATDLEMRAQYLNGERYPLPTDFNEELANTPKPLPLQLKFSAQATKDDNPYYVIDFEPFELMEAFEKLGAHGEKVFIEFDAQIPVTNMKIRVYNDIEPTDTKTPKEYIMLKKFKVEP